MALVALVAGFAGALVACGGSAPPPPPKAEPPPQGVLLDSARRPLERAKAVDDISREHKRSMDEQLDEASR